MVPYTCHGGQIVGHQIVEIVPRHALKGKWHEPNIRQEDIKDFKYFWHKSCNIKQLRDLSLPSQVQNHNIDTEISNFWQPRNMYISRGKYFGINQEFIPDQLLQFGKGFITAHRYTRHSISRLEDLYWEFTL